MLWFHQLTVCDETVFEVTNVTDGGKKYFNLNRNEWESRMNIVKFFKWGKKFRISSRPGCVKNSSLRWADR